MPVRLAGTVLTLLLLTPVTSFAQGSSARPARFNVDVGLGAHLNGGGDAESASFGYGLFRRLTLLLNVERNHVPTQVRTEAGGYSAERGGTLTFLSGEARFFIPIGDRVSPYAFAGRGVGQNRLNVSDVFPDPRTTTEDVSYFGGGVRVALNRSIAVFGDVKVILSVNRGGDGDLSAMVPLRGGLTWRF
jgi:Outer membrane protein beta-barrel domain